jgi:hypothetical protein
MRKLHDEEPKTLSEIKKRWAERVAHMGRGKLIQNWP